MDKVLFIHSSLGGEKSESLALARAFLSRYSHGTVIERALATNNVPHLDGDTFAAMGARDEARTEEQKAKVALSDELIGELEAADTVVMAVPMYNFTIPSTLKAWIDHVVRAGRTFRYSASGPEGLLKDKKAFVFLSRGGIYSGDTAMKAMDFQESYLRSILAFIGLDYLVVVPVEGLGMGPETAAAGRKRALASVQRLTASIPRSGDAVNEAA
jgi:FMN-dependent NADH-azoreductase